MKVELVKRQDRWDLYGEDGSKIASSAPNPVGKLSVKNCQEIENGYDLDELADEHCNRLYYEGNINWDHYRVHFKLGFQKALELLGDKKFNYGHLDKMFTCGKLYQDSRNNAYSFDNVLSKFEQTEWDVEIVTKPYTEVGEEFELESKREPKLDAEGCLILKRI